jgi:hypothetical protein
MSLHINVFFKLPNGRTNDTFFVNAFIRLCVCVCVCVYIYNIGINLFLTEPTNSRYISSQQQIFFYVFADAPNTNMHLNVA